MRPGWTAVHRDHDDELVGYVERAGDSAWRTLTVFGGLLGETGTADEATAQLQERGLAVLAEPWWYRSDTGWVRATLLEARPGEVRALVGSLSDAPRAVTITDPGPEDLRLAEPAR